MSRLPPTRQPYVIIVEQRGADESFLQFNSRRAGCEVEVASSGDSFLRLVDARLPDLFVVDWTISPALAKELSRFIRGDDLISNTPILHFGRAEIQSPLDTLIPAPLCGSEFSRQLLAAIESQNPHATQIIEAGGMRIDVTSGRVFVADEQLRLGSTEVRLLTVLLRNPNVVLNRSQLLDRVWGRASDIEERTVDVHVSRIRKRLRAFGLDHQIQTIRGVGYRFSSDQT